MNDKIMKQATWLLPRAGAALLGLTGMVAADAQSMATAPASSSSSDPSPYYVGASEGLTHDSNVYRIPSGPGDTYSTTSLLGGFDQHIGRQRLFGNANVGLNHYRDQSQLNNTSYGLAAGLDWETLNRLSGNVNVGLNRRLAAPGATASLPEPVRNLATTENINAKARWGGDSLVTLEATLGYSKIDYSAQQYVASDSRETSASLGAYYRPSGALRVGIAARIVDTRSPQALFDPATATYQSNTIRSNNLDFLADYDLTGLLSSNVRLSYTHQSSSAAGEAAFSGLTGAVGLTWRPTGKTTVQFNAAHAAGFDATSFTAYGIAQQGSNAPQLVPTVGQYENSRTTDSADLRLTYAATAKISAFTGASYVHANLVSTTSAAAGGQTTPDTADSLRTAFIGANYAITRNWSLACNVGYEHRRVSGGGAATYAYNDNNVGCSARFDLHL